MSERVEDPFARDKRRAAISVQSVKDEQVPLTVLRSSPYLRFQIGDQTVATHDHRAQLQSAAQYRLITITDNRGHRHYLLEANRNAVPDFQRILAWSRAPNNNLTFHPAGCVPFPQTVPTGHALAAGISFAKAAALKEGDPIVWQYALNQTHEHYRYTGWHVLSDGVTVIPMQRPDPQERALGNWPDYVRELRKRFKTNEMWRHMISMLEGRFMEDLRPRGDLTLIKAVANHVNGKAKSASPHRDRLSRVFCFDGKVGLEADTTAGLQVEEGVAFGEVGHVAWIFRYRGTVVCVVVDKDEADSAAWVFDSAEAAAHLLHPNLNQDYRDRQRTLRQRAIRWCPHNGQWEIRLRLLVLALLRDAGYSPADSLYATVASSNDDARRVSKEVAGDLRVWKQRPAQTKNGGT